MSFIIAMAGKGGTGKTTVAGMLLRYLLEHGKKPVLAVDADANSNLNEVLGVEVESSVGAARGIIIIISPDGTANRPSLRRPHTGGSSNGRTAAFGVADLGSNPSPPATSPGQ